MSGKIIRKLEISDMNAFGHGVGRNDGTVMIVPGTVTGDVVDAEITEQKKNYFLAKAISFHALSEERINSICPVSECGGCAFGGISFKLENSVKRSIVEQALRKNGLKDVEIMPVVSRERYGYRNKITLHYSEKDKAFGLFRKNSNTVVSINECPLCRSEISKTLSYINNGKILSDFLPEKLTIKYSAPCSVIIQAKCGMPVPQRVSEDICNAFPDLAVSFIDSEYDSVSDFRDNVCGMDLLFPSDSFRQVNSDVFEQILGYIRKLSSGLGFRECVDLYCGSGIIGLSLSSANPGCSFTGIEISRSSVMSAIRNADSNDLHNTKFICGDSSRIIEFLDPLSPPEYKLIVTDPPRSGINDMTKRHIVSCNAGCIIYVSCNPYTFARDLRYFSDNGYTIGRIQPFNMFPVTSHVETVVLLSRK